MAVFLAPIITSVAAFMVAATSGYEEPSQITPSVSVDSVHLHSEGKQDDGFHSVLHNAPDSARITLLHDNDHQAQGVYRFLADEGMTALADTGHTAIFFEIPHIYQESGELLAAGKITAEEFMERHPNYFVFAGDTEAERRENTLTLLSMVSAAGRNGMEVAFIDSGQGATIDMELIENAPPHIQEASALYHRHHTAIITRIVDRYSEEILGAEGLDERIYQREYNRYWREAGREEEERFLAAEGSLRKYQYEQRLDDRRTADIAIQAIEDHRAQNDAAGRVAILYGASHFILDDKRGLDYRMKSQYGSEAVWNVSLYESENAMAKRVPQLRSDTLSMAPPGVAFEKEQPIAYSVGDRAIVTPSPRP